MEKIKELPAEDRPREKLLKVGAENLTDGELLAILLRTGTNGKSALTLARELLKEFKGLKGIAEASLRELTSFKGLGLAKAITLAAAFELGRRAKRSESPKRVRSPQEAFNLIRPIVETLKVEELGVITLNSKGEVIGIHRVARGGANRVSVRAKEILRPAVKDLAEGIILFHNHPSENPEPSPEDLKLTRQVKEACTILGIELLDHIIAAGEEFFSFKGEGLV
ncbi:RadC family protein [Thermovibrio sp.]